MHNWHHAFARGTIYRKNNIIGHISAKILIILYRAIQKFIAKPINSAFVWAFYYENSIISENSYLSSSAYLHNTGNKNNVLIGQNVICRGILRSERDGKIIIGDNVYIGDGTIISSFEHVNIGSNILIAHGVNIFDNNSHSIDIDKRQDHYLAILGLNKREFNINDILAKKVTIEDDSWLCFNSIILKGVTIGRGSIVSAGSVVTSDVPPYTIVGGNPARVIKHLEH